jgi:hypothetical protein
VSQHQIVPFIFIHVFSSFLLFQSVLNSTSSGLHSLTSGRLRFSTVSVQLPPSWPSKCLVSGSGAGGSRRRIESRPASGLAQPDVSVVAENLLPSGQPWTEQPGGCGVQGFRVHIPRTFLKFGRDDVKSKGEFSLSKSGLVFARFM